MIVNNYKTNNMKRNSTLNRVTLVITLLIFSSTVLSAQSNCGVKLSANKNRNAKSIPVVGAVFRMVISNTGNATDTFILSARDINSLCSNLDGSSNEYNFAINSEFLDFDKNKITSITLNAGETTNFLVSVSIPEGTSFNTWSCLEIIASSTRCNGISSATVLHSKLIDTQQE